MSASPAPRGARRAGGGVQSLGFPKQTFGLGASVAVALPAACAPCRACGATRAIPAAISTAGRCACRGRDPTRGGGRGGAAKRCAASPARSVLHHAAARAARPPSQHRSTSDIMQGCCDAPWRRAVRRWARGKPSGGSRPEVQPAWCGRCSAPSVVAARILHTASCCLSGHPAAVEALGAPSGLRAGLGEVGGQRAARLLCWALLRPSDVCAALRWAPG